MVKTTTTINKEEALKKAKKAIVQKVTGTSALEEKGGGPPKEVNLPPMPKPAWIQYYDHWCKVKSPYRKGFLKAYDYFEVGMMKRYVDSEDRFVDMVNLHPNTCAVIYPDKTGNIQVLHHLTVSCYGRTIVVGVDGFGSTSEVKAVSIYSIYVYYLRRNQCVWFQPNTDWKKIYPFWCSNGTLLVQAFTGPNHAIRPMEISLFHGLLLGAAIVGLGEETAGILSERMPDLANIYN